MKKLNLQKLIDNKGILVEKLPTSDLVFPAEKEALANEILTKSRESLEKILKQK